MSGVGIAAMSQKLHDVFVYGSLMADDVVRSLLHRIPLSSSATLPRLYSIKGRVYPAILPRDDCKVPGKVLRGITDPELDILDTFEDFEYQRQTVMVELTETSMLLVAHAYVWTNKDDPNLYGDWDFEKWKQDHLDDFVKMTKGFMEELSLPKSESKMRVATYESFYKEDGKDRPST